MRMPTLPLSFHAPPPLTSRSKTRSLLLGLVAGAAGFGVSNLSAQSEAEIADLRAQMQQMQENYAAMEAKVKAMEAQVALGASIAKSRTLTGPDGKEVDLKAGPVVVPDLSTFTRNFKWHGYFRVGTGFTSNGVGQTFNFNTPDIAFGKTSRLGNENDIYMETGPILDHMLGDDPDVVDVRFKMTFQLFSNVDRGGSNLSNQDFNIGYVEAYIQLKNVIKSAPEVIFWGGTRFYDRYDIHPSDYFYIGTAGTGAGVENIDVGIGKLAIAYFGGINGGTGDYWRDDVSFNEFNLRVNSGEGKFYRHSIDIRLGDIPFLGGKLKLLALGSYMHGGDFEINYANGDVGEGNVDNSGGAGGGFVQSWDLPPNWGKGSNITIAGLYGWGLTDFGGYGVPLGKLGNAYTSALNQDGSPVGTYEEVNPYNNSQLARANIFWVWNPTDNFAMGTWAQYWWDDQGFRTYDTDGSSTSGDTHLFSVGIRPYYWIWGPFALQASAAYAYLSNKRTTGAGFGDGGSLGIITIAPTIKPRGGFWTRPELRAFATFAVWSDEYQGAIGGAPYAKENYGFLFGVQMETWF